MSSASTVVWVRVPSLPASGNAVILLLSGRARQTSASRPANTFDLWEAFDEAESSVFEQDACGSGTLNIASGAATLS